MPKVQDTNETEYLAAVEEGKAIVADVSGKQWALGDLALKVEKKYGENRLEQFVVDINFPGAACTLGRYRSVCLAFPKTGGRPRFFASTQILQRHDDRIQIVTANPNISVREARELMRKWRAEHPDEDQAAEGQPEQDQVEEDLPDRDQAEEDHPGGMQARQARGRIQPGVEEHAINDESHEQRLDHLESSRQQSKQENRPNGITMRPKPAEILPGILATLAA